MTTDTPDVLALREALEADLHADLGSMRVEQSDYAARIDALIAAVRAETPVPSSDVTALREALEDAAVAAHQARSHPGPWASCESETCRHWQRAAVRAETLAGSGVVEALRKHHRHTVRIVLMADDSVSLWCRSCDQHLIAATPPTPALTAARLAEAARRMVAARDAWLSSTSDTEGAAGSELDAAHDDLAAILAALAPSPAPEVER